MAKIRIEVYRNIADKSPFENWFLEQTPEVKAIIQTRIDRLSKGNFGDIKKIVNSKRLYEVRIHAGPGYRIYFSKFGEELVILLSGGMKKKTG